MDDENQEILNEFIREARDHLAAIEPDLLELERQGSRATKDVVNRIFRAIHSTKGGASFLAFDALTRFSHAMENVLMLVRDGQLVPSSAVVDLLLRGVDVLRTMLDDIHHSNLVPCDGELAELQAICTRPVTKSQPAPSMGTPSCGLDDEVPIDVVRDIAKKGYSLYSLRLNIRDELVSRGSSVDALLASIDSVGQCLKVTRDVSESDEKVVILCATALELDLLATAIELPPSVITKVDLSRVKANMPRIASPEVKPIGKSKGSDPAAANPVVDLVPVEKGVAQASSNKEGQESLRVRVELLTRLMNVAGELVLGRNQLLRSLRDSADSIPGLVTVLQHVDRVTTELQEGIMQTRMQPLSTLFARYARMIRDLARQLGKRIELETSGNEVELDKSIIEALADPITHVVRNAIDHGFEGPEERVRLGKTIAGRITISAFHESGQVFIVITDDGRGINRAKVRKKALEKGLVTAVQAAALNDREIMSLVLMPGFSTAERVTELSGRGVGMDVVRTNVEKLGGHVELDSTENVGTTVRLRLPLTLAIIPSLVVRVGEARYAIPQVSIVELVWIHSAEVRDRLESVQGAPVLRLRNKLLPIVSLAHLMRMTDRVVGSDSLHVLARSPNASPSFSEDALDDSSNDLSVVVLRAGDLRFGVLVDELFEWEEIVVKPVPSHLMDVGVFAGTTILGDGRVIMILDPGGIAKLAELSVTSGVNDVARRTGTDHSAGDNRSIILFSNAPGELFAVPQDRVLRLERIEPKQIEFMGGRHYVKYRGHCLPVIRMENCYPVSPVPSDAEELFLVIPREEASAGGAEPSGGILVWKILDAVDVNVSLSRPMFSGPGIMGSAVVDGALTMFMNPTELLVWAARERVQRE